MSRSISLILREVSKLAEAGEIDTKTIIVGALQKAERYIELRRQIDRIGAAKLRRRLAAQSPEERSSEAEIWKRFEAVSERYLRSLKRQSASRP
jgi:hypothetical protein